MHFVQPRRELRQPFMNNNSGSAGPVFLQELFTHTYICIYMYVCVYIYAWVPKYTYRQFISCVAKIRIHSTSQTHSFSCQCAGARRACTPLLRWAFVTSWTPKQKPKAQKLLQMPLLYILLGSRLQVATEAEALNQPHDPDQNKNNTLNAVERGKP